MRKYIWIILLMAVLGTTFVHFRSPSAPSISILGNMTWATPQQEPITLNHRTWNDPLSSFSSFIVVPWDLSLTTAQQQFLQQAIQHKKVVLFYGKDVKPEQVGTKLGMDVPYAPVSLNVPTVYYLYGYGWSPHYHSFLPLFFGGSPSMKDPDAETLHFFATLPGKF